MIHTPGMLVEVGVIAIKDVAYVPGPDNESMKRYLISSYRAIRR